MEKSSTRVYPGAVLAVNLASTAHFLGVLALWRSPALALALLYLAPPILARLLIALFGRPEGTVPVRSRAFLVWWCLASLQMVFARLPFLEELLRMIPMIYSGWLRLWGSRIGRMVYWSPGVVVLDRSYLDLGDHVVLGVSTRLCPHQIDRQELTVAPIRIGDRAQLGGYCLLLAGSAVERDQSVHGTLVMRPFSRFANGRLRRADQDLRSAADNP